MFLVEQIRKSKIVNSVDNKTDSCRNELEIYRNRAYSNNIPYFHFGVGYMLNYSIQKYIIIIKKYCKNNITTLYKTRMSILKNRRKEKKNNKNIMIVARYKFNL